MFKSNGCLLFQVSSPSCPACQLLRGLGKASSSLSLSPLAPAPLEGINCLTACAWVEGIIKCQMPSLSLTSNTRIRRHRKVTSQNHQVVSHWRKWHSKSASLDGIQEGAAAAVTSACHPQPSHLWLCCI